MNCIDAKRHLDLFLDGELDVGTNLKVLEHLNLCPPCSKIFDGERWVGGEIRRRLAEEKAPAKLRERIRRSLELEKGGRPWPAWASLAAAVFIAVSVGWVLMIGPSQVSHAQVGAEWLAGEVARRHDEVRETVPSNGLCLCPACVGASKPEDALQTFYGKCGARVCPCCLSPKKDYALRSGGVWREAVRGVTISWTTRMAPSRAVLSHASVPATAVRFEGGEEVDMHGHPMRRFRVGPRIVLMGQCGECVCIVVLDSGCEADRLMN